MNIFKKSILTINFILIFYLSQSVGQSACDTLPFLNCNKNYIITNNSEQLTLFVQKMINLNEKQTDKINIIHIGDSHLQAGFLTEKIKHNIFHHWISKDTTVSPGFIFPYTIAQTNNPFFYKVNYTGTWEWSKNVDVKKKSKLGLSGITVSTTDSSATFSIKMSNKQDHIQKYYFNAVKIFHNADSSAMLKVNNQEFKLTNNISEVNLNGLTDSVSFELSLSDSSSQFELYGLILEIKNSPIHYHTVGVNGATAQSYLKCDYLSSQLASINPDLVIISLGTNEAYADDYLALEHEYILKDLVLQIRDAAPNTAILFITPNDHIKLNATNKAVAIARENIIKVCRQLNLSYWDYYQIMGGEDSVSEWFNSGLTGNDKLHFRKAGYEIQGELFTKAFVALIAQYKKEVSYIKK